MMWADRATPRPLAHLSIVTAVALAALAGAMTEVSAASADPVDQPSCTQDTCVFLLAKGRLTAFDAPGPAAQDLVRINNRGQIVGGTKEPVADESFRGFLRDRRGRFSTIDFPGAAGTSPFDLNDRGEIVGTYSDTDSNTGRAADKRGFLRNERGEFTTIHVPGAVQTLAFGINNRGQVVGEYLDADGGFHGYLWEKDQFTTIDGPDGTGASATDINDRGQVVGSYFAGDPTDPATDPEALDGFLLSQGVYTTFDTPGPGATVPLGINNRGQIVVSTTTGSLANTQGFLFSRGAAGPLTPIDPPGPVGAPGTLLATGINDAGAIVGLAGNPNAAPDDQPSPMAMPMMMMSGG